jgi:hypothetical protein
MKRISKYGRCKHNGARFRQQSSKVRQSKWRIDPDNAILQNLKLDTWILHRFGSNKLLWLQKFWRKYTKYNIYKI